MAPFLTWTYISCAVQIHGPKFHDRSVARSLPGVRVEGDGKERKQGVRIPRSDVTPRLHLSATICWVRVRVSCVHTSRIVTGFRFGDLWRCAFHARSAGC